MEEAKQTHNCLYYWSESSWINPVSWKLQTDLKHRHFYPESLLNISFSLSLLHPQTPFDHRGIIIMKGTAVHSCSTAWAGQATGLMLIICLQIYRAGINIPAQIKLPVFVTNTPAT